MNDSIIRRSLVELLQGGHAHVNARQALDSPRPENRNARPGGVEHSVWELLEHLRIAQEDILRYTLDANWISPGWPDGYWPTETDPTEEQWLNSVSQFFADLDEVIELVKDAELDLTSEVPHGEGRTYLRQVMLVADHNAYHIGQIVQVRKALRDWPEQGS
jgi:uncharacterized damage-inducible protein DinB